MPRKKRTRRFATKVASFACPQPNQAVFPEKKTLAEAAMAMYISQKMELTVAKVFHNGIDPDVGPFLIIQDFVSRRGLDDALEAASEDLGDTPFLNPDIITRRQAQKHLPQDGAMRATTRTTCLSSYRIPRRDKCRILF